MLGLIGDNGKENGNYYIIGAASRYCDPFLRSLQEPVGMWLMQESRDFLEDEGLLLFKRM